MPIPNAVKADILNADIDFAADTFRIALFTSSASFSAATAAYSATNEVSGTGYTAGGREVTGIQVRDAVGTTGAFITADPISWSGATIAGVRYALLYDTSHSNRAVAYYDFVDDQSVSNGTLSISPGSTASTALFALT